MVDNGRHLAAQLLRHTHGLDSLPGHEPAKDLSHVVQLRLTEARIDADEEGVAW